VKSYFFLSVSGKMVIAGDSSEKVDKGGRMEYNMDGQLEKE